MTQLTSKDYEALKEQFKVKVINLHLKEEQ